MAAFDFLDNVKNTLTEQFAPQQGVVGGALPPNFGQTAPAPDLGPIEPQGMEQFAPEQEPGGTEAGIPQPQGGFPAPEAAMAPTLGNSVTLEQLLGMGLNQLLLSLLAAPSAGVGGQNAAQGSLQGIPQEQGL